MQFRADSIDSEPKLEWQKTPHGYVAFATLARKGHKLTYQEGNGRTRQEYLNDFTTDSLNSIRGMPLCLDHPQSGTYQGNKSGVGIGHFLQEILITDSGDLLSPVTVTDKRGIDLIDQCLAKGVSPEISPAYWVEDVRADSQGNYEQIRGRYDHAALLLPGQGRGGASISLRLDSAGQTTQIVEGDPIVTGTTPPATPPAATTPPTNFEQENAALKAQIETLTGEIAGYKATIDGLSATHVTLDSVKERVATLARMGRLTADSATTALDLTTPTPELQRQHIKALKPDLSLEGKTPEYIAGVFDSLVATPAPTAPTAPTSVPTDLPTVPATPPPPLTQDSATAIATTQGHLNNTRSDSSSTNDPISEARQKQLARINENGNKPASK